MSPVAPAPAAGSPTRPSARWVFGVAALLWLAALGLPTTTRGVGSALNGRVLADLIGSGTLSSVAPRWLGLVGYVMPLGGGLVLLSLGFDRVLARRARLVATCLASAAAVAWTLLVTDAHLAAFGAGSWLAVGGCAAGLLAAFATPPPTIDRSQEP